MARGSNRKRGGKRPSPPRQSSPLPPADGPGAREQKLLDAHEPLLRALEASLRIVTQYRDDPQSLFDLDELEVSIRTSLMKLTDQFDELDAALQIAVQDLPLATTYRDGGVWAGPQRPRYVLSLADQVQDALAADGPAPTTVTYAERLADADTAALVDPACPESGANGARCRGTRVRLGGGIRGRACWAHLNTEERNAVRAARTIAVAEHACPRCRAAAGSECLGGDRQPTQPHDARLTLAT